MDTMRMSSSMIISMKNIPKKHTVTATGNSHSIRPISWLKDRAGNCINP